MSCCQRQIGSTVVAGAGAATLAPSVSSRYTTQTASCGATGATVSDAPYLVTPDDYANLAPIVSVPVIERRGRQNPNNVYVFVAPRPGTVQVQSPKVGRY